MMKRFVLFIFLSMLALSACKKSGEDDDNAQFKGMTAQQLTEAAKKSMSRSQYASAIKQLEALESMYPFHDQAEKTSLTLIYAYYENKEYAAAAAAAERFMHLYPRAANIDYAYYMKGMANFQQQAGTFANFLPIDESLRDPGSKSVAYLDFSMLVQRFPNSRYTPDAKQRMIYLRNLFANRELHAARYYFNKKMYVAAAERANYLIRTYPQADSVSEALRILYRSNRALGLKDATQDIRRAMDVTGVKHSR